MLRDFESTHSLNEDGTPLRWQFMVWCSIDPDPENYPDGEIYYPGALTDFGYVLIHWRSLMCNWDDEARSRNL